MRTAESYLNERPDHLGIVAGVCQEIGLAAWLEAQDPSNRKPRECGNGDRRHDFEWLGMEPATIESGVAVHVRTNLSSNGTGAGMRADMLEDDCLGRTLDWLYAHDPTKVFAGIANRTRQVFGISARQVHVDTTSFSVSGAYSGTCERAQASLQRQVSSAQATWKCKCWHLSMALCV